MKGLFREEIDTSTLAEVSFMGVGGEGLGEGL
jgi:hypothetical protein